MLNNRTGQEISIGSKRELGPDVQSAQISYRRGQEVIGHVESGDYWYCVLKGAVREYAILAEGRRRIVDFLLPGDFFGFPTSHRNFFAADAVSEGTVLARYPRRSLEQAADANPQISTQLREIAFEALWRSQVRLLILGRVTANAKVSSFLIEMAERSFDARDQTVLLPMSRYDIADYLAISVETVSRALTVLDQCGAIRFADRHRLQILDSELLETGFDHPGAVNEPLIQRRLQQTREKKIVTSR